MNNINRSSAGSRDYQVNIGALTVNFTFYFNADGLQ
jgi:hypothetical protein